MPITTPKGYRVLDDTSLAEHLGSIPAIRARLGGEPGAWQVHEVGDGNLNLVGFVAQISSMPFSLALIIFNTIAIRSS